jgi:circadian clock protein KaiC
VAILDRLLNGGVPESRTVVVTGAPGTGKTTLGLQFLAEGIHRGARALLALVDEKPRHVIEDARAFGWAIDAWTESKSLRLLDASPYFAAIAKPHRAPTAHDIANDLAGQVRGFAATRLVIDPITSLIADDRSPAQIREFLRTLIFTLEDNLDVTSLLIAPRTEGAIAASSIAEELASGVIELSVVGVGDELHRSLLIKKMRGSALEPLQVPVRLVTGSGLVERTA